MGKSQQQLFETEPAPWELDGAGDEVVATVVFATGARGEFDYLVPDHLRGQVEPGRRVRVPLGRGNRSVLGYCMQLEHRAAGSRPLKSIRSVVDAQSLLSPSMLRLTRWMSDHYLCHLGQVLEAVVPAAVRGQAGTRETLYLSIPESARSQIGQLKLPAKQAAVLEHLAASPRPLPQQQLAAAVGCTMAPIHALRKKGIIRTEVRRMRTAEVGEAPAQREENLQLNPDQQAALESILTALNSGQHETVLVHGITASGKTEVYIQAIDEVVRFGRQAIVLVPEISLTPQTRQRFRSRFDQVAVLHSHMLPKERYWQWDRIARGEVQVVVGARSAIFAPTPHLGLIVIDEEHDASFKQDSAPRYHARLVAQHRAAAEKIPLLLGSATPSLESWHQAILGNSTLLRMPRRAMGRSLPNVTAIDLRNEFRDRRNRGAISRPLHQAMDLALKDDGQIILLLNRRGFATHIQCNACGLVVRCPNCDIALTHHRHGERAICHYCEYMIDAPAVCPECRAPGIRYSGFGTQKLEAEVRRRFPDVSCLRMDSDTMRKPGSHEAALNQFRKGEKRILLGTQMIAKGLDFPNVTLVGVVNADTALHFPDFRAAERTFQLVAQVSGRTGRGDKGGRVLVQTFSPDHPAIRAAQGHDYEAFAANELPTRQQFGYPPHSQLIRFVVRGQSEATTLQFAEQLSDQINQALGESGAKARLLGPTLAPIAKLRGKFRVHLLLCGVDGDALRAAASQVVEGLNTPAEVQWTVDVDPLDML